MAKKGTKTWWRDKCDEIFAEIVKRRAGFLCEETKGDQFPQCAHLVGRGYYSTRWDLDNAICLSRSRHCYYTNHPIEWRHFIEQKFGKEYLEDLERRAIKFAKWILEDYEELYDKLSAIRDTLKEQPERVQIRENPGRRDS